MLQISQRISGSVEMRPFVATRLRPACASCGAPHPQAGEPPDVDMPKGATCPGCGALASEPSVYQMDWATVVDPAMRRAGLLMKIGAFLHRLADRMQ